MIRKQGKLHPGFIIPPGRTQRNARTVTGGSSRATVGFVAFPIGGAVDFHIVKIFLGRNIPNRRLEKALFELVKSSDLLLGAVRKVSKQELAGVVLIH